MTQPTRLLWSGFVAASVVLATPGKGQETRRAVVIQIAGANFYLDAGTDAGLRTGDTLGVRRAPAGAQVGLLAVIGATRTSTVVAFASTAFPVTRGDTVFLGVRVTAPVVAAGAPARSSPASGRVTPRLTGTFGVELAGTHSETVGLGADPVISTQDFATPAFRLRAALDDPAAHRSVTVNLRAQHRAGPTGLFAPATTVRVYDVHVDQGVGVLAFTAGRFLSTFDHASGFWDGAALRVGRDRGVSVGVAGGFEPLRTNEGFSTDLPKYAGFLNVSARSRTTRYAGGATVTRLVPRGGATLTTVDVTERLDWGRAHLGHELELTHAPGTLDRWVLSRLLARILVPAGKSLDLYATYVRDHPPSIDSAPGSTASSRERVAAGLSFRAGQWYASADASVNEPGGAGRAYALSLALGFPTPVPHLTLSGSGSYLKGPWLEGVLANPSLEYRLGTMRFRGGYQFYLNRGTVYSITTHGADFMVSQALSSRIDWVTRITLRTGGNLKSAGGYSSLDVRF